MECGGDGGKGVVFPYSCVIPELQLMMMMAMKIIYPSKQVPGKEQLIAFNCHSFAVIFCRKRGILFTYHGFYYY